MAQGGMLISGGRSAIVDVDGTMRSTTNSNGKPIHPTEEVFATSGDGMTDFNEKDWIERVKVAKDGEALRKLIHEIPLDMRSMNKDDPASSTLGVPQPTTPLSLSTRRGGVQVG